MQYLSFPGATSCFAALPVALVPLLLPYIHLRAAGAAQEEVIASRRRLDDRRARRLRRTALSRRHTRAERVCGSA